jgi:hypothetical protein
LHALGSACGPDALLVARTVVLFAGQLSVRLLRADVLGLL